MTKSPPGIQGVCDVRLNGIRGIQHCGYTALCVPGRTEGEGPFAQDCDFGGIGKGEGESKSRCAAADNEDIAVKGICLLRHECSLLAEILLLFYAIALQRDQPC